jgi:hypothetical protein
MHCAKYSQSAAHPQSLPSVRASPNANPEAKTVAISARRSVNQGVNNQENVKDADHREHEPVFIL